MRGDPTLITGVGKRAGFHLAKRFLQRGMPVIGTYRTRYERLSDLQNLGADLHACDFNRREDVDDLIYAIRSQYPRLRGIIHNASDWVGEDSEVPLHQVMERMMRVHAGVPYEINHRLAPLLQACEDEHADIVHISDYVASRGSKKHIAYAASKAAQDNLTLSFAAKLAPKVKVNSLAPALLLFNEGDSPAYRVKALGKCLMKLRQSARLHGFCTVCNQF